MNIINRASILLTQKIGAMSGISTKLKFKGGSEDTCEGKEKKKKEDWRNLMNIPSGSQRGTMHRHQCLPAENSTGK